MQPNPDPEQQKQEAPARLFRDDTRFALGRIAVFQYLSVAVFAILLIGLPFALLGRLVHDIIMFAVGWK